MTDDLTPIQREYFNQKLVEIGIFETKNTLPEGMKHLNPNPGVNYRIVEDTMRILEDKLQDAGLRSPGDDVMVSIEGRICELVALAILAR